MECRGESSVSKQDQSSYPETMTANAEAVRKVAEAVQGTLGPKGLDTMLVKDDGGVIVTNDGVTILNRMEIHHPVAQMIVGIANAQQEEVGDGTTTGHSACGSSCGRRGQTGKPWCSRSESDRRDSSRGPFCSG